MKIKLISLKNWCTANITPLAWQRIVLKILPQLRERGFNLSDLEDPNPDQSFGEEEFKLFTATLEAMYGITFPKEIIEKIK